MTDRRCKLGLGGRLQLVRLCEQIGQRAAARRMGVSPATANTYARRWRHASEAERISLACLLPRSSRPKSCPWALSAADEQRILQARATTNWGPMRLQVVCGRHRSTIWKVLWRHGVSRRRRSQRQTFKRYEWAETGALLHIDAFRAPKFDRPGHWATGGQRSETIRTRKAGTTYVIGVVDDHTRLAYCELHSAENATTVTSTLRRAAQWFAAQGCGPVQAVMSDNAKAYTSNAFQDALAELGARHILTPPFTPRWNGKVERFFQTLDSEWAHGRVWPNSRQRDRALSSWLRFYNRQRPHSAAGGRAPITRVQQVRKQDS